MTSVKTNIEKSLLLPHPVDAIWQVLADFGGVANWAPRMRHSRLAGSQAMGVGTRRIMRHVWGFRIEETVTHWEEGHGFAFRLDRAPPLMRDVEECWTVSAHPDGTLVNNRVSYHVAWAHFGRAADALLIRMLVGREMVSSLRSLKHFADYRFGASAVAEWEGNLGPE